MTPRLTRAVIAALAGGLGALALPAAAGAFGTIDGHMGQSAEHEKITRTLACGAADAPERCFQPRSINELAGEPGTLGGVGTPDSPLEIIGNGAAHCDDGDYLPGAPYAPADASRATAALQDCVRLFGRNLDRALDAADALVDARGAVVPGEADVRTHCEFGNTSVGLALPRAKCRVFNGLGRALHAAEDFWSHSTWGDLADPARPQILAPAGPGGVARYDVDNPAGLGRTEVAPFLRYPVPLVLAPTAADMLAGTSPISGCDDSPQAALDWAHRIGTLGLGGSAPQLCPNRAVHSTLNKDKGTIDWRTGAATQPGTPRGRIGDNFQRAVTGARAQARAVWGDFSAAVLARYGDRRGGAMLDALTRDTPWTACTVSGSGALAVAAPAGAGRATRSVNATIVNRTREALACATAVLQSGEWASLPPDRVAAGTSGRFRVESNLTFGGGPEGRATFAIGDTGYAVQFRWDNPLVGSNSFGCQVTRAGQPTDAGYRCSIEGGKGNDAFPNLTVAPR